MEDSIRLLNEESHWREVEIGLRFKILFPGGPFAARFASKLLLDIAEVEVSDKPLSEEEFIRSVNGVDALIVADVKVTRRVIEAADMLKIIAAHGVGVDNIDIEAATEKGIYVTNTPQYQNESVAQHALSLMLLLSRRTMLLDKEVRMGGWKTIRGKMLGTEGMLINLEDKTLGLIGLGGIGSRLAQLVKSFGMHVLAVDPYVKPEKAELIGVEMVSLETILKEADYVSIHCPLTSETKGLIGEKQLKMMKRTAFLVNTARGTVVDEKALYHALSEGWIAGAGLDVLEAEPPSLDNPLFQLDNVVLTPHIAGTTEEARRAIGEALAHDVRSVLEGGRPRTDHIINPQVLSLHKQS